MQDGTPDDRMLAHMQFLIANAQTELDETGELPTTIEASAEVTYERLGASDIRLCGTFQNASPGQARAAPFFDVIVDLHESLTVPRPRSGRQCYDVTLEAIEEGARIDAIRFRKMNAIATAADCAFSVSAVIPADIQATRPFVGSNARPPLPPACGGVDLDTVTPADLRYAPLGDGIVRLCAHFQRGYDGSAAAARVFDPLRDARFPELTASRPEPGLRCYDINLSARDAPVATSVPNWEEPIELESLTGENRRHAEHDKQAIADIVNVLRLARCAYTMSGAAPETSRDAIAVIARRPGVADRYNCDWAPYYFGDPQNAPVATYERVDQSNVRVCATFRRSWPVPLALNFYHEALADWPTSLPELQRPISQPGRHCYAARLTNIGSGAM